MRAATHEGECQVCGRVQKLPNGTLAKHGYTVQWGFFEGTCWGADSLPLEVDNSLLAQAIEWATRLAQGAAEIQEKLLNDEQPEKVWAQYYDPSLGRRGTRTGYASRWFDTRDMFETEAGTYGYGIGQWAIPVSREAYDYQTRSIQHLPLMNGSRQVVAHIGTALRNTAMQAAWKANVKHVEREMAFELRSLESYIVWQTRRNSNWRPKHLRAVAA